MRLSVRPTIWLSYSQGLPRATDASTGKQLFTTGSISFISPQVNSDARLFGESAFWQ